MGLRFLVVDDFPTMRRIIRGTLNNLGYDQVVEAEDGIQALMALGNRNIDFVICDWNMPVMDGLKVLKKVRLHRDFKDLPFLMLTAESQKANVIAAVEAGASGYMVKPFLPEELELHINRILDRVDGDSSLSIYSQPTL